MASDSTAAQGGAGPGAAAGDELDERARRAQQHPGTTVVQTEDAPAPAPSSEAPAPGPASRSSPRLSFKSLPSFTSSGSSSSASASSQPRSHGIAAALAPIRAVAEVAAVNPFTIGALTEDGTKVPASSDRSSAELPRPAPSGGEKKRRSKRSLLFAAGRRSMSPFRPSSGRSNSASRLPVHREEGEGAASQGNASGAVASPRSSYERASSSSRTDREDGTSTTSESDDDDAASICPRNNAFTRGRSDSRASQASSASLESEAMRSDDSPGLTPSTLSDPPASPSPAAEGESSAAGDPEEEDWDPFDIDPELLDNTLYNAGCLDVHESQADALAHEHELGLELTGEDDDIHQSAPNVVLRESQAWKALRSATSARDGGAAAEPDQEEKRRGASAHAHGDVERSNSGSIAASPDHALVASRPVFERNRCTITLVHGQYEKAVQARKRPKRYVVASDGSEEAAYATEWTIGTVLRGGDEALIVSVMETDSKLDSVDHRFDSKRTRTEHQKIRQNQALILARQATALLQRTRLGVRISCQALHAKNARHMLLDLIDFFEPTLVVVGSRGLGSLKGILLGSTSHYLVQKSSCPVMVVRKRLKLPALPKGKADVVAHVKSRHLQLRDASIEKNATDDPEAEDHYDSDLDADGEGSDKPPPKASVHHGRLEEDHSTEDERGRARRRSDEDP